MAPLISRDNLSIVRNIEQLTQSPIPSVPDTDIVTPDMSQLIETELGHLGPRAGFEDPMHERQPLQDIQKKKSYGSQLKYTPIALMVLCISILVKSTMAVPLIGRNRTNAQSAADQSSLGQGMLPMSISELAGLRRNTGQHSSQNIAHSQSFDVTSNIHQTNPSMISPQANHNTIQVSQKFADIHSLLSSNNASDIVREGSGNGSTNNPKPSSGSNFDDTEDSEDEDDDDDDYEDRDAKMDNINIATFASSTTKPPIMRGPDTIKPEDNDRLPSQMQSPTNNYMPFKKPAIIEPDRPPSIATTSITYTTTTKSPSTTPNTHDISQHELNQKSPQNETGSATGMTVSSIQAPVKPEGPSTKQDNAITTRPSTDKAITSTPATTPSNHHIWPSESITTMPPASVDQRSKVILPVNNIGVTHETNVSRSRENEYDDYDDEGDDEYSEDTSNFEDNDGTDTPDKPSNIRQNTTGIAIMTTQHETLHPSKASTKGPTAVRPNSPSSDASPTSSVIVKPYMDSRGNHTTRRPQTPELPMSIPTLPVPTLSGEPATTSEPEDDEEEDDEDEDEDVDTEDLNDDEDDNDDIGQSHPELDAPPHADQKYSAGSVKPPQWVQTGPTTAAVEKITSTTTTVAPVIKAENQPERTIPQTTTTSSTTSTTTNTPKLVLSGVQPIFETDISSTNLPSNSQPVTKPATTTVRPTPPTTINSNLVPDPTPYWYLYSTSSPILRPVVTSTNYVTSIRPSIYQIDSRTTSIAVFDKVPYNSPPPMTAPSYDEGDLTRQIYHKAVDIYDATNKALSATLEVVWPPSFDFNTSSFETMASQPAVFMLIMGGVIISLVLLMMLIVYIQLHTCS